ncbi:hypothetical protein SLE2022_222230 [Rubroshorea leprosula]
MKTNFYLLKHQGSLSLPCFWIILLKRQRQSSKPQTVGREIFRGDSVLVRQRNFKTSLVGFDHSVVKVGDNTSAVEFSNGGGSVGGMIGGGSEIGVWVLRKR